MGGFQLQAKLIAALMIVAFFFLNDAPEAYAQLRYGSEKALTASSGRVRWRRMDNNGGTEGSNGGKSLDTEEGKVEEGFRFRSLRSRRRVPSPPPAPTRNKVKSTMIRFNPLSPPPPLPPSHFH